VPSKVAGKPGLTILHAKQLGRLPWLIHGFSTRSGGCSSAYGGASLNLGLTRHDPKSAVESNRAVFLERLGASGPGRKPWPLVTLRQVHSDIIHCVAGPTETPLAGDGLITATPGLVLAVQTADCLPIILVDPKRRAIGVFHAGWRGTLRRIVEKGIGEMRLRFACEPPYLKAAIGPGIHGCCYEVGVEVKEKFASQFAYAGQLFREVKDSDPVREKYPLLFLSARPPGHTELLPKLFLDLVKANRRQLIDAGVPAKNIEALPLCTSCRVDLLFSYRAEKGVTGRMLGAAGIRTV
jgi:purine-nucleoside/S-methyl-5'-thioadenosine phosphorylase / adenosine deaminase